jgi:hypothetical protein
VVEIVILILTRMKQFHYVVGLTSVGFMPRSFIEELAVKAEYPIMELLEL